MKVIIAILLMLSTIPVTYTRSEKDSTIINEVHSCFLGAVTVLTLSNLQPIPERVMELCATLISDEKTQELLKKMRADEDKKIGIKKTQDNINNSI